MALIFDLNGFQILKLDSLLSLVISILLFFVNCSWVAELCLNLAFYAILSIVLFLLSTEFLWLRWTNCSSYFVLRFAIVISDLWRWFVHSRVIYIFAAQEQPIHCHCTFCFVRGFSKNVVTIWIPSKTCVDLPCVNMFFFEICIFLVYFYCRNVHLKNHMCYWWKIIFLI